MTTASGGQITFDPTVFLASNSATANTIYLTNGIISLPSGAFLNGLTSVGSNLVTIDGGGTTAIFSVASGNTVNLANMNFAHGKSVSGSVVQAAGALTVSNCTFSNNAGPVIRTTGSLAVTGRHVHKQCDNGSRSSIGRGDLFEWVGHYRQFEFPEQLCGWRWRSSFCNGQFADGDRKHFQRKFRLH